MTIRTFLVTAMKMGEANNNEKAILLLQNTEQILRANGGT